MQGILKKLKPSEKIVIEVAYAKQIIYIILAICLVFSWLLVPILIAIMTAIVVLPLQAVITNKRAIVRGITGYNYMDIDKIDRINYKPSGKSVHIELIEKKTGRKLDFQFKITNGAEVREAIEKIQGKKK